MTSAGCTASRAPRRQVPTARHWPAGVICAARILKRFLGQPAHSRISLWLNRPVCTKRLNAERWSSHRRSLRSRCGPERRPEPRCPGRRWRSWRTGRGRTAGPPPGTAADPARIFARATTSSSEARCQQGQSYHLRGWRQLGQRVVASPPKGVANHESTPTSATATRRLCAV